MGWVTRHNRAGVDGSPCWRPIQRIPWALYEGFTVSQRDAFYKVKSMRREESLVGSGGLSPLHWVSSAAKLLCLSSSSFKRSKWFSLTSCKALTKGPWDSLSSAILIFFKLRILWAITRLDPLTSNRTIPSLVSNINIYIHWTTVATLLVSSSRIIRWA